MGGALYYIPFRNWHSSVAIAKNYGLDGRGSIPGRDKKFVSIPQRADRFWVPPNLLFSGYRGALSPRVNRLGRKTNCRGDEW
jgi:hypothetical protein